MNKIRKRKSVFKILILRILAVVLLLNILVTAFQIYKEINLRRENDELLRQKISNEITDILNDWALTSQATEGIVHSMLKNVTEKIIENYKVIDFKKTNLKELLILNNLDPEYYLVFIIENGIVVNTTFPKDLGLDLYSYGDDLKNYLKNVLNSGAFFSERFGFESTTERLKIFVYQATPDKKYIVEIGAYSKIADEMLDRFRTRLNKLISENSNLVSVNFWIYRLKPHGFLNEKKFISDKDSLIRKSFVNKTNFSRRFIENEKTLIAEYFYSPIANLSMFNNEVVLTIVWDLSDSERAPIILTLKRQLVILLAYIALLIIVLLFAVKNFSTTLRDFLVKTTIIADGNLKERVIVSGNNEFTTLSEQFNYMVDNLENSQNSLIQQKNEISQFNSLLQNQNEEISAQRDELENQRNLLSDQKKELTDSINYAQRIQTAVLPKDETLKEILPEHFVLFKPRDIVSGDFYWIKQIKNFTVIVVADCTGHGVPGAFMSMLGISMLNDIVNKSRFDSAGEILDRLRSKIKHTLNQEGKEHEQKDGMDISLTILDHDKNDLQYAGAFNPLYIIRDIKQSGNDLVSRFNSMKTDQYELIEIKGDNQPIAIYSIEKNFTTHNLKLYNNDSLYMFSDGFYDQFGGPKGKKFMAKRFKELLLKIQKESMTKQKEILNETLLLWKKEIQQIDDILVLGVRWKSD